MSVTPTNRPISHVYDAAYTGVPNWDIGRPQEAFVALAESGRIRGSVLDVGCGSGELAVYLARRGHDVLGIDLSPRAIEQAGRRPTVDGSTRVFSSGTRSISAGSPAPASRSRPSSIRRCFTSSARRSVSGSSTTWRQSSPAGVTYVLGDARRVEGDVYGITPAELRERFAGGDWEIEFAIPTAFERRWSANGAYFVGIRRC